MLKNFFMILLFLFYPPKNVTVWEQKRDSSGTLLMTWHNGPDLSYSHYLSEIIQLIRYENNERLGSYCFTYQNDHWNSNLSKNRPTCLFIGSFSINDLAIFGSVFDKQYDSLSDLIISFGTAKNQVTFYRHKYWNTKYINYFYLYQHIRKIW